MFISGSAPTPNHQTMKHKLWPFAVQLLSHVWLFVTPWATACQASLSFTISLSLLNSHPLSQWWHPTISSSVAPFSSCPQSFRASGSGSLEKDPVVQGKGNGSPLQYSCPENPMNSIKRQKDMVFWPRSNVVGGFLGGTVSKNLPANAANTRDAGLISGVEKIPWRRKWQASPVFLTEKFHGQRSLAGYSPWGHKELNMCDWLSTQTAIFYFAQIYIYILGFQWMGSIFFFLLNFLATLHGIWHLISPTRDRIHTAWTGSSAS